jgi:hypothetical protein
MNVEIGTDAAQFLEKEYINEIFVAVYGLQFSKGELAAMDATGLSEIEMCTGGSGCVSTFRKMNWPLRMRQVFPTGKLAAQDATGLSER